MAAQYTVTVTAWLVCEQLLLDSPAVAEPLQQRISSTEAKRRRRVDKTGDSSISNPNLIFDVARILVSCTFYICSFLVLMS